MNLFNVLTVLLVLKSSVKVYCELKCMYEYVCGGFCYRCSAHNLIAHDMSQ